MYPAQERDCSDGGLFCGCPAFLSLTLTLAKSVNIKSTSGNVTFGTPISACDIGLLYSPTIHTLPIDATIQGGQLTGHPRKIGKAVVELSSTYNIQINSRDVVIATTSIGATSGLESFTGKKEVYILGYSLEPNIEIRQTRPLPMRLLGITTEVYY